MPERVGIEAAVVMLRLLATWLYDCPPAVSCYLSYPSHLPLLVDLVGGRLAAGADVHVTGDMPVL